MFRLILVVAGVVGLWLFAQSYPDIVLVIMGIGLLICYPKQVLSTIGAIAMIMAVGLAVSMLVLAAL